MFNETMFSFARIFYDAWLRGDYFFCSIWVFTCKKQSNQNFIKYKNKTEIGSNQTISVRFNYFILKIKTQPTGFGLVWFGYVSVRFGYFILKTKNYIVI
jgi:hypothetical protein